LRVRGIAEGRSFKTLALKVGLKPRRMAVAGSRDADAGSIQCGHLKSDLQATTNWNSASKPQHSRGRMGVVLCRGGGWLGPISHWGVFQMSVGEVHCQGDPAKWETGSIGQPLGAGIKRLGVCAGGGSGSDLGMGGGGLFSTMGGTVRAARRQHLPKLGTGSKLGRLWVWGWRGPSPPGLRPPMSSAAGGARQ